VLGQHEGALFQDKDPPAVCVVTLKQRLCHHRAERATSDDDHVEIAAGASHPLSRPVEGLLQGIAEITPHVVERERRAL
jgi:hypothetical protein